MPLPALPIPLPSPSGASTPGRISTSKQRILKRILAIVIALALVIIIFFIWNPPTPAPTAPGSSITQQNLGSSSTSTTNSSPAGGGNIQAYIVGAVKHPGVYTLPAGARVYALLQAAGGPLPKANLVALNLASTLTDGEEVYVTVLGEVPPTYMGGVPGPPGSSNTSGSPTTTGQLVNINTASVDAMRQSLHISSTTAQNIVNYRLQHGPFTSVDQLLQVVSKTIYDKIEGQVTV